MPSGDLCPLTDKVPVSIDLQSLSHTSISSDVATLTHGRSRSVSKSSAW